MSSYKYLGVEKTKNLDWSIQSERIQKTGNPDDKVGKKSLYEDFKLWFQQEQGSRKIPKGEEIYEYMTKKYGSCTKKGWCGVKFIQEDEEDDIINQLN